MILKVLTAYYRHSDTVTAPHVDVTTVASQSHCLLLPTIIFMASLEDILRLEDWDTYEGHAIEDEKPLLSPSLDVKVC